MLQIIPVIDLKQGQVVHAKHGQRAHYQPIKSILSFSSDIFNTVDGLLKLYPFRTIYIADIDAISNTGNHFEQIELLSAKYPDVMWWVDNGIGNVNARILYSHQVYIRAVFGSENIHNLQDYQSLSEAYEHRHVLSLDKFDNVELGAEDLHNTSQYWPDDIVCMTLNNVGSKLGPDIERLKTLMHLNLARKKSANIFAAGGVRHLDDCLQLKHLGIAGVLLASALHNGEITAKELSILCR